MLWTRTRTLDNTSDVGLAVKAVVAWCETVVPHASQPVALLLGCFGKSEVLFLGLPFGKVAMLGHPSTSTSYSVGMYYPDPGCLSFVHSLSNEGLLVPLDRLAAISSRALTAAPSFSRMAGAAKPLQPDSFATELPASSMRLKMAYSSIFLSETSLAILLPPLQQSFFAPPTPRSLSSSSMRGSMRWSVSLSIKMPATPSSNSSVRVPPAKQMAPSNAPSLHAQAKFHLW